MEEWYTRPDARAAKVGDILNLARESRKRRLNVNRVELGMKDAVPRPEWFDDLYRGARQVVREFKAEGVMPTKEDVEREVAKRVRAARSGV